MTGIWLGLLLASWVVATTNFRTVDRVLDPGGSPEAGARFEPVPVADRRMLLRHLASEINRSLFRWRSLLEIVFGATLAVLVWPHPRLRVLAVAVLAVVLAQAFAFTSSITDLGRSLDFLPRPLPADVARRFGLLHGAYVMLDLAKAAALAVLAAVLAWTALGRPRPPA